MNRFAIIFLFFTLAGCSKSAAKVDLKVKVTNGEGAALADAKVMLNGEHIGDTNAFGTFTYRFKAPFASTQEVKITKESPHHYIAPFSEVRTFQEKIDLVWDMKGVLYLVPKPKVKVKFDESVADESTSSDGMLNSIVPKNQFGQGSLFLIDKDSLPTLLDLRTDNTLQLDTEETTPQNGTGKPTPDETIKFDMATFHFSAGHTPLDSVKVYACHKNLELFEACTSNSRGRCVAKVPQSVKIQDINSWIIKKPGYSTLTSDLKIFDGNVARFSMKTGQTIDVLVKLNRFGRMRYAPGLQASLNGSNQSLPSGSCGYAGFEDHRGTSTTENLKLKIVHESLVGSSQEAVLREDEHHFYVGQALEYTKEAPNISMSNILVDASVLSKDVKRIVTSDFQKAYRHKYLEKLVNVADLKQVIDQKGLNGARFDPFTHLFVPVLSHSEGKNVLKAYVFDSSLASIVTKSYVVDSDFVNLTEIISGAIAECSAFVKNKRDPNAIYKDVNLAEILREGTSRRWLTVVATPRPVGVSWNQGVMHSDYVEGPIEIHDAKEILVKAPPGFLDLRVILPSSTNWHEVGIDEIHNLEKDFLSIGQSLAQAKDYEGAANALEAMASNHSQYPAGVVLRSMIEEEQLGTASEKILGEVIKMGPADSSFTRQYNAMVAMHYKLREPSLDVTRVVELGKNSVQLGDLLLQSESARDSKTRNAVLFMRGYAKNRQSNLTKDVVLSADAEADLRAFLIDSEKDGNHELFRKMRVIATKNIENTVAQ
ncbi:MAG: hypothetical protein NT027_07335 [Proteobacteria bacterium]|nr:hypothetical protein [Pseudomonadota bacterium]